MDFILKVTAGVIVAIGIVFGIALLIKFDELWEEKIYEKINQRRHLESKPNGSKKVKRSRFKKSNECSK